MPEVHNQSTASLVAASLQLRIDDIRAERGDWQENLPYYKADLEITLEKLHPGGAWFGELKQIIDTISGLEKQQLLNQLVHLEKKCR